MSQPNMMAAMTHGQSQGDDWLRLRQNMIDQQLRPRGLRDERVLSAMLAVPREQFVREADREQALDDRALQIDHGQTISQPYIVAYMTSQLALGDDDRVLEVGTGSGYQTAVLAMLCKHVYSIERVEGLQARASAILARLGLTNVTLAVGDGSQGLGAHAPYDGIIITAAAPRVPPKLVDQLAEGGRMIVPVGPRNEQTLVRVDRQEGKIRETPLLACRFVKLVGEDGFDVDQP